MCKYTLEDKVKVTEMEFKTNHLKSDEGVTGILISFLLKLVL